MVTENRQRVTCIEAQTRKIRKFSALQNRIEVPRVLRSGVQQNKEVRRTTTAFNNAWCWKIYDEVPKTKEKENM